MKTMLAFDLRWAAPALVTGLLLLSGTAAVTAEPDERLKATGQTKCYDPGDTQVDPVTGAVTGTRSTGEEIPCKGTGQDGEYQAGTQREHKDLGDGTIRDLNTALIWEKKSWDGSIHDLNNLYTFEEAITVHVATLNSICARDESVSCSTNSDCRKAGVGGPCGFGGRQDWRLPNVIELKSITSHGHFSPGVAEEFNNNCAPGATVLTGSCTQWRGCVEPDNLANAGGDTWSSTSFVLEPTLAQVVGFDDASVAEDGKERTFCVRAVAGGL